MEEDLNIIWPDTKQWDKHDKFDDPLRKIAFNIIQMCERSKYLQVLSGEFDDLVDNAHQILRENKYNK